eukprot:scaffold136922_cov130-Phaeocystis_antarctica.AAC.2
MRLNLGPLGRLVATREADARHALRAAKLTPHERQDTLPDPRQHEGARAREPCCVVLQSVCGLAGTEKVDLIRGQEVG